MTRLAVITAVVTLLLSAPALAQDRSIDISVFGTWVDSSGRSTFQIGDDISNLEEVEFDSDFGYGLAVNVFWTPRISTEFAAALLEPDFIISERPRAVTRIEPLEMMPLTAVLQYHFSPRSTLDFYVGAGAAYVIFDEIEDTDDIDDIEFDSIDFDDDVGLVVNAGLGWAFTPAFGLYLDAKYVPLDAAATAVVAGRPRDAQEIKVDPLMLSAGLTFRF